MGEETLNCGGNLVKSLILPRVHETISEW